MYSLLWESMDCLNFISILFYFLGAGNRDTGIDIESLHIYTENTKEFLYHSRAN
jgi:hypothetical protein